MKDRNIKMAKRIYYICSVLFVLSLGLLGWVAYDYFHGNASFRDLVTVILNVCLFGVISLRNRKVAQGGYKDD